MHTSLPNQLQNADLVYGQTRLWYHLRMKSFEGQTEMGQNNLDGNHSDLPQAKHSRSSAVNRIIAKDGLKAEEIEHEYEEKLRASMYAEYAQEVEKSPAAKELIGFLVSAVPDFLERYGAEKFPINEDNVRFVTEGKEIRKGHTHEAGCYSMGLQAAFVWRKEGEKQPYSLLLETAAHELVHFTSFQSVEAGNAGDRERRFGLEVIQQDSKVAFTDMNEAITEELTTRCMNDLRNRGDLPPMLTMALEQNEAMKTKYVLDTDKFNLIISELSKHYDKAGLPEFTEALKKLTQEEISRLFLCYVDLEKHFQMVASYLLERIALYKILSKIFDAHRSEFETEEDVFGVFARAAMDGHILELARLIEGTFGKGSFRRIGENSMTKFLQSIE